MTIQEELKLESKISTAVTLISWLAIFILMVNQPAELESEMILCVLIFVTSVFFKRFLITCPECEKSIISSAIKHKKHTFIPDLTFKVIDDKCRECGCDFLQDAENHHSKNKSDD